MRAEHLDPATLVPRSDAPRHHPKSQLRALTKSLQAFGQVVPILIDAENRIISGLALWQVANNLGLSEVVVMRIEYLAEEQVKALMIALNRLGDLSTWDDHALNAILLDLHELNLDFDIEATGFTEIEIELRVQDLDFTEPDEAPLIVGDGRTIVSAGELWNLGDHLLYCGDALVEATWQALMGSELAAAVVTDPPFNVEIDGHVTGSGKHRHREFAMAVGELSQAEFTDFLKKAMANAHRWSAPGSVHHWAMDWRHVVEIGTAGQATYERFLNMAVWTKNRPGMGSYLRSQHELFFIFGKGGAPARNNVQLGRFGRSRSNIWCYPGAASLAKTAEEGNPLSFHPTVKPLALIADVLLDCTVKGDIVADPFAGSGTTLIACEKLGRRARVIELDTAYCDLIIRRWQHWSGELAVRLVDGVPFVTLEEEAVQAARDGQA
ncbi:MAG: site-specific DNA-methyltransferase [Sphingomonas sp.]